MELGCLGRGGCRSGCMCRCLSCSWSHLLGGSRCGDLLVSGDFEGHIPFDCSIRARKRLSLLENGTNGGSHWTEYLNREIVEEVRSCLPAPEIVRGLRSTISCRDADPENSLLFRLVTPLFRRDYEVIAEAGVHGCSLDKVAPHIPFVNLVPAHMPFADHLIWMTPGLGGAFWNIGPDADVESYYIVRWGFCPLPVDVRAPPVDICDRTVIAAQEVIGHDVWGIRQGDAAEWSWIVDREFIPAPEAIRER